MSNEYAKSSGIDRIKLKIEKLFRLAEGSANEHEAANAMAKARKLMDEYQLTKVDILNVNGEDREFSKQPATRTFANIPQHMNILSVAVAEFNDCQAVREGAEKHFKAYKKTWGNRITFRGFKHDVDMAVEMYESLMVLVNKLCAEWLVEIGHEGRYPVGLGSKFKLGACETLCKRLNDLRVERQKLTTSTGTSLVVVKGAAVAEYFGEANYSKAKQPKFSAEDPESIIAFTEGKRRAKDVEIQRKISDD